MNIRSRLDDSAVSPVVGVILMVAVTVILSAVIGAFVLDLGNGTQSNPQAGVTFDEQANGNVSVQIISQDNADAITVRYDDGKTVTFSGVGNAVEVDANGKSVTVVGELDGKESVLQSYDPRMTSGEDAIVVAEGESIQSAVDGASDGDVILVQAGTYHAEGIAINKDVTLRADGAVTITDAGTTTASCVWDLKCAFNIQDDASPTLEGFNVSGDYAISVDATSSSGDWVITDMTLSAIDSGVEAGDSSGNWTIQNTVFTYEADIGVWASGSTGDVTINNNVFRSGSTTINGGNSVDATGNYYDQETGEMSGIGLPDQSDGVDNDNDGNVDDFDAGELGINSPSGIDFSNPLDTKPDVGAK